MRRALRLAIVGGDRREAEAAAYLGRLGHAVTTLGGYRPVASAVPADLWASADAVIGPALGTNAAGDAFYRPDQPLPIDPHWLDLCRPGTPWLVGRAGPWLQVATTSRGLCLSTYADTDEFALLNAVPTAEGAMAEAGRLSGRTVWGEPALVVGGGRCAQALVSRLLLLGGTVTVAARNPVERARATALGAAAIPLRAIPEVGGAFHLTFNTVPALVLGPRELVALPPGAVIVDVASAPGGTDFVAAEGMGLLATLLPGIPGRFFPVTAGRIVAATVLQILAQAAQGGEGDAGAR